LKRSFTKPASLNTSPEPTAGGAPALCPSQRYEQGVEQDVGKANSEEPSDAYTTPFSTATPTGAPERCADQTTAPDAASRAHRSPSAPFPAPTYTTPFETIGADEILPLVVVVHRDAHGVEHDVGKA
jgi:hypothetical protein